MTTGIDYSNGTANIATNGVRYGVISLNRIASHIWEDLQPIYPTGCGNCGHDTGSHEETCPKCGYSCDLAEPIGWEYSDSDYEFQADETDLFVLRSPYVARVAFCSPCAPGAGDLSSPCDDGPQTYCLGPEYFDEYAPCPYPQPLESAPPCKCGQCDSCIDEAAELFIEYLNNGSQWMDDYYSDPDGDGVDEYKVILAESSRPENELAKMLPGYPTDLVRDLAKHIVEWDLVETVVTDEYASAVNNCLESCHITEAEHQFSVDEMLSQLDLPCADDDKRQMWLQWSESQREFCLDDADHDYPCMIVYVGNRVNWTIDLADIEDTIVECMVAWLERNDRTN